LGNFTDNGPSGGENNEFLSPAAARPGPTVPSFSRKQLHHLGNDFLVCNKPSAIPSVRGLPRATEFHPHGSGNLTIGGNGTSSVGAWMKFNPIFLGGATAPTATLAGQPAMAAS